ncbi:MAG: ribbon-helix-helix protein, CopG family [Sphingomicrobium sp.]
MMRHGMHDTLVRFRANEALVAQVRAKAEHRSMTVSELVRAAVRRELEAA